MHCYSVVGIVTRYGLNGPRIESQWGTRFSAHVQTGSVPIQLPVHSVLGLFAGGKAAGAWR